jgi:hypothetical protein
MGEEEGGLGMATQDPQSAVSILTYANGDADVTITGKGGTLTLTVSPHGPTIAVRDPERGQNPSKVVCSLKGNGHLKGWFVEKKGDIPRNDTLVFFPAKKKRPTQKRTTKP